MRTLSLLLVGSLVLAACDSASTTGPEDDSSPPDSPSGVAPVTLTAPADGATVPQNDPTIGCPAHPTAGYGLRRTFLWQGSGHPEVVGYHLHVKNVGARYPAVNTIVIGPEYLGRLCQTFVVDRYLDGWQWRVRPILADGEAGPWSETWSFSYAPCRLENGEACH